MNWNNLVAAAVLLVFAICLEAGAQEPESPSRRDLASFRIISERNIFNPNRSVRKAEPPKQAERTAPRPPESVALVGTMSYEKGSLAFFEGSRSEYRKVLKLTDEIAGYKVSRIGHDHVTLEGEGEELVLQVGMQMKKGEEGWQIEGRKVKFDRAGSAKGGVESSESAAATEESDILKKLMQKREQELEK